MKKLTAIILTTALAIAAGQASAQTAAQGAVQGAVPAAATAAPPPAAPSEAQPPRPTAPVVKDFAAARSLELERSKFHMGAIEQFRKCIEGSKAAGDITSCQSAYRASLTAKMNSLIKQGKFAAAYDTQAYAANKPAAPRK